MLEPATENDAPEITAPIDQSEREYLSGAFAPVVDEIGHVRAERAEPGAAADRELHVPLRR
jgi:hypothetical protein